MDIRPVNPKDAILMERILRFKRSFIVAMAPVPVYYAERDGMIAGVLWAEHGGAFVEFTFAVKWQFRRQGIARALVTRFVETCQARRIVCTSVHVATARIVKGLGFHKDRWERRLLGELANDWELVKTKTPSRFPQTAS